MAPSSVDVGRSHLKLAPEPPAAACSSCRGSDGLRRTRQQCSSCRQRWQLVRQGRVLVVIGYAAIILASGLLSMVAVALIDR